MSEFETVLNGGLKGVLSWARWDGVMQTLREGAETGWYVYFVGEAVPEAPIQGPDFDRVLAEIDGLLRRDHRESYLGIVYADDLDSPTLVKIYDPNNLGSSCGSSGHVIPPGWVISRMRPRDVYGPQLVPQNRRRWWSEVMAWVTGKPAGSAP